MSRDYEEFLELLNRHDVRYLVIGAHAVAYHAVPRATKDIDIYHDTDEDSAEKLVQVIREFFSGADIGLTAEDFATPGRVVQLGVAPQRIDIVSRISGIPSFADAWSRRVEGTYGDVDPCHYLSLPDLIQNKEAVGREQDRADLVALRRRAGS